MNGQIVKCNWCDWVDYEDELLPDELGIPECDVNDFTVCDNIENAYAEMELRKQKYIEADNDWTFNEADSTENCIVFDDDLKEDCFSIQLIQLA